MSKLKIEVTKVSAQTQNGTFIHTLKTEGKEVDFLGTKMKGSGLTYFVSLATQLPVGHKGEINLNAFDVVERVTDLEDQETGEMQTYTFKWLYPKR